MTCTHCGIYYSKKVDLLAHKEKMKDGKCSDPKFPCTICGLILASDIARKHHPENMHSEVVTYTDCNEEFENKNQLRKHRSVEHGNRSVKCAVCSKKFPRQKIETHLKSHRSNKVKPQKRPLIDDQKLLLQAEIDSLIKSKKQVDKIVKNFVPQQILDVSDSGQFEFRNVIAADFGFSYLCFVPYTIETQQEGSTGHLSSTCRPYEWLLTQLELCRDIDQGLTHCEHTTVATLKGQKSDWGKMKIVLAGSEGAVSRTTKFFANSVCQVSNKVGSTSADELNNADLKIELIRRFKKNGIALRDNYITFV